MGCILPGSSVHGISQARILEWAASSFSRGSSWCRDWTWVSRFNLSHCRQILHPLNHQGWGLPWLLHLNYTCKDLPGSSELAGWPLFPPPNHQGGPSVFILFFFNVPLFYFFIPFIFISWRLITLQYCSGFCHTLTWISQDLHVFPVPIPPPTSLSTWSFWVFPVHQAWALVSCIQPGLVICFTLDNIHVSMLFSWNIPPSPSPTESTSLCHLFESNNLNYTYDIHDACMHAKLLWSLRPCGL